jgi:ElaB/YqjD/DUF883 family membrane-anchored ribosome-binding protein
MDDLTRAMDSTGRSASSLAGEVSRRARDLADRAGTAAGRASDWVREQKLAENATTYVNDNPGKAVVAALVAGALLAFLFTRKKNWP